jgi:hypothetical protein
VGLFSKKKEDETRYEIRIPHPDGRWVPYGPTFTSMTAAELWAARDPFLDKRDRAIGPVTGANPYDEKNWP